MIGRYRVGGRGGIQDSIAPSRRSALLLAGAATGLSIADVLGNSSAPANAQGVASKSIEIKAGRTTLSGIYRPAPNPKALIFCVHGGSYTSRYFNFHSQPQQTLFELAPQFGYSVLAVDRPGYGTAEKLVLNFDDQAALLREAAAVAQKEYAPASQGVFLVGHSIGAMLCMIMASPGDGSQYLGLDLNGAGLVFRPAAKQGLATYAALANPPRQPNKDARSKRMFGPAGTYTLEALDEDFKSAPLSQPAEIKEAIGWEERMAQVAPSLKVPVNFSLSEFDALWESGPAIIERARGLFSSSPFVEARVQRFAGHSVHLHSITRAYNLRTIAFVEDSLRLKSQKKGG